MSAHRKEWLDPPPTNIFTLVEQRRGRIFGGFTSLPDGQIEFSEEWEIRWWEDPREPEEPEEPVVTEPSAEMGLTGEAQSAIELYRCANRRGGNHSANPYKNSRNGFHITFYENISSPADQPAYYESWKIGHFYSAGEKKYFRQGAFTVLSPVIGRQNKTIRLLSHPNFLLQGSKGGDDKYLGTLDQLVFPHRSNQTVELAYIVHALKQVAERWADLSDHLSQLLSDDFMEPEKYVKNLSDDETLSRSKLYFWVMGCLIEFIANIKDNILQWELFQTAHFPSGEMPWGESITESERKSETQRFQELFTEADHAHAALANLLLQFENQLETTKALRDGLFNASVLIESRESKRLGQNVKLLTYVSIFYLPLAFCAALWTVPNIAEKSTRNPLIITATLIGLITYVIVFNLENLTKLCGRMYNGRRTKLVDQMRQDSAHWIQRGERFEGYRSNDDLKTASEWWIVVYQGLRWIRQLRRYKARE